jgi:hypothetical protein
MADQISGSESATSVLRERTIAVLRSIEPELRQRGVAGLRLFGSSARGEATPVSDVDLLLTPAPGRRFSLLDMSGVRLFVSEHLGREAAVVIDEDASPEFTARISDDLVTIY